MTPDLFCRPPSPAVPWWLVLLTMLPEPEKLPAYAKNAYAVLKAGRNRAKRLGKEHRRSLESGTWR